MDGTNGTYEFIATFLEQFGWLHDSLVYHVEFHGNLRYDLSVTISLRAEDRHDDMAVKSVRLVLGGVSEFRLAQGINQATFETSSGAGIAAEGERVFLDLGSPERLSSDNAEEFTPVPRHRSVEDVRTSEFYFDFTDVIAEIHPMEDIADDHFGDLQKEIFKDVFDDKGGDGRRPPRDSRPD